jgi:hypothetical protein
MTIFICWLFNDNGIATSYVLDGPGFESWNGKETHLFSKTVQTGSEAYPATCPMGMRVPPLPARKVHHSPPSSVEVKNEWSDTPAPPTYLDDVDKDNDFYIITS